MLCIPKGFSMDSDRKKDSLDRKGKERELKELPDRQQKKDKEGPGRFTSFIYNSIKARPRNPEEEQRALRRENDYMSRFAGRTIGEIHVYRNNVFEGSNRWVDRTLNSMHYPTREKQIRNDLLFHTGDTLDPVEIRNNRLDMRHMSEEKIREVEDLLFSTERPVQERFFKGRGVDFRTGEIELWPTDCYLCGGHGLTGIRINEKGESSVPGLYAAGDVSPVARAHLSGAFTFGQITAENATEYASTLPDMPLDEEQVLEVIRDRDAKLAQADGKIPIEEFEYKVRRLINDYIRPPKNEYKLDRALWWMDRFKKELRTDVRIANKHDLFKAYEVENIIHCAAMSALASKERKESRWGLWHMRSDYPMKDDEHWMKHIVLKQGDSFDDIRISYAPIIKM